MLMNTGISWDAWDMCMVDGIDKYVDKRTFLYRSLSILKSCLVEPNTY
jgi:hypothetical protein